MNSFNAIITDTELTLTRDWAPINEDNILMDDGDLSETSNEEAGKVFAEWKSDDELDEIMEIDAQLGSNLLDDTFFNDEPCLSPTGPLEELVYMNMEDDEQDKFFVPSLDDLDSSPTKSRNLEPKSSASVEDKFSVHFKKLAESMKRSQETRRSLTLKSPETGKYDRLQTINGVLSSVEQSTRQIQYILEPRQIQ